MYTNTIQKIRDVPTVTTNYSQNNLFYNRLSTTKKFTIMTSFKNAQEICVPKFKRNRYVRLDYVKNEWNHHITSHCDLYMTES